MLSATGIIRTVDKHSIVTTLFGGGGGGGWAGEQFVISFANRPIIFGQDCSKSVEQKDNMKIFNFKC